MDYDEQDNGASGSIPKFGAIFMSNTETKKECFNRQIFALPSSKAEFVKHIKSGMVLFLFEFKKRQLFGVYQATSDGAVDIIPHAFNCLGKHLPAQVCFTRIWHCDPLTEKEFRDAIRENYYSAKKFNFGLSEEQVRKLLYLFSSRKLKDKIPPRPLSETVVEVAAKQRRLIGDDRFELSERGYMEPTEYNEFYLEACFDLHANSFSRAKEEKVSVGGGRADTEGKLHPYSEEDFLAKRRRLGNDDKLITNDVAEDGIYNRGALRTFRVDSPKDSFDEVRRSADGRRLLVERVNQNQVDRIVNRSECLVDPLDVIANDDYRFMQRNRLIDEYNLHSGSRQAFASDFYGESLDNIKHAIDSEKFFLDDSVQRNYNPCDSDKPVDYSDSNLDLFRHSRELIDDQEPLMNRKLENGYHLDCDGSLTRAFENFDSPLYKIRKSTTGGRLPYNESEPDFGTSCVEDLSSENLSCPWQCGHRIIYDRKYTVAEGCSNEDMAGNNLCSASLEKTAGYVVGVGRQVVDDGRFRKIVRADNEEDSRMLTNPVRSMEHPSFSQLKQNFLFSDKLLPENGLPQSTISHNFDPSRSTFGDAIITRAVPYSSELPSFSHGYSASIPANKNSSLVRKNHPDQGSLGDFYPLSKNRSPQYILESEKSSRPLDIAPGFGNKGFPTGTSGHQSSLLHESTSSFANSNLPVLMDLNASAPLNYSGSLFPKHSPQCTDLENVEGEQGSFAYLSKPRDHHFVFDRNIPTASLDMNKHVCQHKMDMFGGQDCSCFGPKDFGVGIRHPERDLVSHENQYMRSSSMDLKLNKVSEAPHANSNVSRRSVFTRLTTSREESKFVKERNDTDFNHDGCYMDATADEIMEMLQQGGTLSQRKLGKSRVGGQPTDGENAVNEKKRENAIDEKKSQSHIETNHSTLEKNKLNDASLDTADSIDEVPKETRVVDFKRRCERKKILVGNTADSYPHNTITLANEEVNNSTKTTLKRKRLVRPVFSKTGSAADAIFNNETLQNPPLVLDKNDKRSCETAISVYEAEVPNENAVLSDVSASGTHQPMDCNSHRHQNPEEQQDLVAHVLPSTSAELKEHETTNVNLQIGNTQVLKATTQQKSFGIQASAEGILAKDADKTVTDLNLPKSSLEGSRPGAACGNSLEKPQKAKKRRKKITRTCKVDTVSCQ